MVINFSTSQKSYAENYLKKDCFKWLNSKQRIYILNNLGDIRVQDPLMYSMPKIEIHNNQSIHNKKIQEM